MSTIDTIEKLINAYIDGNSGVVVDLIENEIAAAKKQGYNQVARRLRNISSRIPKKESFFAQNVGGIIKSPAISSPLYFRVNSNVELSEVVLERSGRNLIDDFLIEWKNIEELSKYGIAPTNKILFYGPPGTGKTKMAYALAYELQIPLIIVRLDELISSFLGKTGRNIREIFDLAEKENVIILLDEIDTIAKHRDDNHELGELKRVVTVLLQNIDNFPENSIVIGATNHETLLDKAVWRRFPLKIEFKMPTEKTRENMLKLYLEGFQDKVSIDTLVELSEGLNGSSIHELCQSIKKQIVFGMDELGNVNRNEVLMKSIKSFYLHKNSKSQKTIIYDLCRKLLNEGYSLADLEKWSGISYTTLRDNIK